MFPDWLWRGGGEGSAPVRKEGSEKDNAKREKSVPFGTAACGFLVAINRHLEGGAFFDGNKEAKQTSLLNSFPEET